MKKNILFKCHSALNFQSNLEIIDTIFRPLQIFLNVYVALALGNTGLKQSFKPMVRPLWALHFAILEINIKIKIKLLFILQILQSVKIRGKHL